MTEFYHIIYMILVDLYENGETFRMFVCFMSHLAMMQNMIIFETDQYQLRE